MGTIPGRATGNPAYTPACRAISSGVDPQALIQDLPVGLRQRVEILKALYRQATILILDEPTAVLTPGEVEHLFETLMTLAPTRHVHHLYHS